MENQTQQPVMPQTNDFLTRMDQASNPVPETPKKKLSKGALIGIIVGAVLLVVGVVVVLIIVLNQPKQTPTPTGYVDPGNTEPEVDPEMEERNTKRANDLSVLVSAVKKYQNSQVNDNQLPTPSTEAWEDFVSLYVPEGIKDGADEEMYKIGGVCKMGESCVDVSKLTWEEDAHKIYVLYNADCNGNTRENVVVSSTRKRRIAMFAIIEGDKFICATN